MGKGYKPAILATAERKSWFVRWIRLKAGRTDRVVNIPSQKIIFFELQLSQKFNFWESWLWTAFSEAFLRTNPNIVRILRKARLFIELMNNRKVG
ncbi:MAG: hypothetical protein LBG43_11845 [Treponema sp.]|nr:hypothetical protein [Treponema sp.]